MMRARLFSVVAGLTIFASASLSRAQLSSAYDDAYRPLQDTASKIKDASKDDYDNLKSMAETCADQLDKLADKAGSIGSNFKESENQSWASDAKGKLVDACRSAKDKANSLKSKAGDKNDCSSEISDLQSALTDVSDDFRESWKKHEDRAGELKQAFDAQVGQWWNSAQAGAKPLTDARKAATDATTAYNGARTTCDRDHDIFDASLVELTKAESDLKDTMSKAGVTTDDIQSAEDKRAAAEDRSNKAWDNVVNSEKTVTSTRATMDDANRKYTDEFQKYKDGHGKDDELLKQVEQRGKLLGDFNNEYKHFDL